MNKTFHKERFRLAKSRRVLFPQKQLNNGSSSSRKLRAKGYNSSAIGQKDGSQNGCYKKTKHGKLSKNEHFLPHDTYAYACVSGGKKYSFSETLSCFVFWEHTFWDSPFYLTTDESKVNEFYLNFVSPSETV